MKRKRQDRKPLRRAPAAKPARDGDAKPPKARPQPTLPTDAGPWPLRLAIGLIAATAVTIWVGALVTSLGAGMTSPAWPRGGGLDLVGLNGPFWLLGTRDQFVDGAHRLLGLLTGAGTVALLVIAWRRDPRRAMRVLVAVTGLTLLAVAVLGVTRVWYDSPWSALWHAAGGVLLLSLLVAVAAIHAPARRRLPTAPSEHGGRPLVWLTGLATLIVLVQVTLGTLVRHYPIAAGPPTFRLLVFCHLAIAACVVVLMAGVVWRGLLRGRVETAPQRWATGCLAAAVTLQIGLGAGTWVMRFGWPTWLFGLPGVAGYTLVADGPLATQLVTAHVTNAALILAASVWVLVETVVVKACKSESRHAVTANGSGLEAAEEKGRNR